MCRCWTRERGGGPNERSQRVKDTGEEGWREKDDRREMRRWIGGADWKVGRRR